MILFNRQSLAEIKQMQFGDFTDIFMNSFVLYFVVQNAN